MLADEVNEERGRVEIGVDLTRSLYDTKEKCFIAW